MQASPLALDVHGSALDDSDQKARRGASPSRYALTARTTCASAATRAPDSADGFQGFGGPSHGGQNLGPDAQESEDSCSWHESALIARSMANDVSNRDAVASFPPGPEEVRATWTDKRIEKWMGLASRVQRSVLQSPLRIGLALFALCAFIAVDVFFIVSAMPESPRATGSQRDAPSAATLKKPTSQDHAPTARASSSAFASPSESALPLDFDGFEDETSQPKRERKKHFRTVREAAARSCSTSSVDGLSRQIVAQARCIDSSAFVALPQRSNLVAASHVFPYFEAAARKHLLRALDAHPHQKMTVHSALRTLAQQYLVWCWGADKRCGVQLAARPGESNHETGLALDIGNPTMWRSALEAERFQWFGPSDRVHFDYKGSGAQPRQRIDVMAFQQLWNLNHGDDAIAETGKYDSATEARLKKSPSAGFPIGARCHAKPPRPHKKHEAKPI